MRRPGLLCLLVMTGCSSIEVPPPPFVPSVQPGTLVVAQGLTLAAGEAKLIEPLEASMIREAGPLAPNSPSAFVACVRSVSAPRLAYAVFFKNDELKFSRLALTPDHCFDQVYQPFIRVEPRKAVL